MLIFSLLLKAWFKSRIFKTKKYEKVLDLQLTITGKTIFRKGGTLHEKNIILLFVHSIYLLDYRIAPEYKYPAALEDGVAAFQELLKRGHKASDIVMVGDSAGGNLVLATALYLKDRKLPQPGALVLISPWTTMGNNLPSRSANMSKDVVLGTGTKFAKCQEQWGRKSRNCGYYNSYCFLCWLA